MRLLAGTVIVLGCYTFAAAQTAPAPDAGGTGGALPVAAPGAVGGQTENIVFPIGKGVGRGDVLAIPVVIGSHTYLFGVDTGSRETFIDSAAAAADPAVFKALGQNDVGTAASGEKFTSQRYLKPAMRAEGVVLRDSSPVLKTLDMARLRAASWRPLEGILGMDVLGNYVVHLDFEHHKLEFLVPESYRHVETKGEFEFPLEGVKERLPQMAVTVAGMPNVLVRVDTGNNASFSLIPYLMKKVAGFEKDSQGSWAVDLSGEVDVKGVVCAEKWSFAGLTFEKVWIDQAETNFMGLGVLCNFDMTCDFANSRAYLRPIRESYLPDKKLLGFGLELQKGDVVVVRVNEAAGKAGLKVDDIVEAVEGKPVKGLEGWQIGEVTHELDTVRLTVRRGDGVHEVTLVR